MTMGTSASRESRLRSNHLITLGLSLATLALFAAVGFSTYTRAFGSAALPPTATIPADLGANLAQVSQLVGRVQRVPAGETEPQPVRVGDTIAAGEGSVITLQGVGYLTLSLANRAVLYLDDRSELELQSIEGTTGGVLNFGRLLVSNPQTRNDFSFTTPNGAILNVSGRSLVGLTYDPATDRTTVDCLRFTCELRNGSNTVLQLAQGERGFIGRSATPQLDGEARFDLFQDIGARNVVPTPTRLRVTRLPATAVPTVERTAVPTTAPVEPVEPTATGESADFTPTPEG